MAIGILGFGEFTYLPFLRAYAAVLDEEGVPYDILYWNREHLREGCPYRCRRLYRYTRFSPGRRPVAAKLVDFLGYRRWAQRLLRENGYDRLIVLTTMPAVLLAGTLARRFPTGYIFDVRDYAYEHFAPFLARERMVVRHAALCVTSSPGFRAWLPAADWRISHNVDGVALRRWLRSDQRPPASVFARPVRVLRFVGRLRSTTGTRAVVDQLGADPRYAVHFHGDSVLPWDPAAYARRRGAAAVRFHGRFRPDERAAFYEDCDLVLGFYDTPLPGERTLLSNKLYESAMALRPILVTPRTYLAEIVARYGLGLAVDLPRESLHDAVERYAASFNPAAFAAGCRGFLTDVLRDDEEFVAAVRAFARGAVR
jgi:glycosyltransferase involved in cell wall biosynthesis